MSRLTDAEFRASWEEIHGRGGTVKDLAVATGTSVRTAHRRLQRLGLSRGHHKAPWREREDLLTRSSADLARELGISQQRVSKVQEEVRRAEGSPKGEPS